MSIISIKNKQKTHIFTPSPQDKFPQNLATHETPLGAFTLLLHRSTPLTIDSQFWLPEGECIIFTISQVIVICQQFWTRLRAYALNYLITIPRFFFPAWFCLLCSTHAWKAFASLLYLKISNPSHISGYMRSSCSQASYWGKINGGLLVKHLSWPTLQLPLRTQNSSVSYLSWAINLTPSNSSPEEQ